MALTDIEPFDIENVAERPPAFDDDTVRAFLAGRISHEALPAPKWGPLGREVFERSYARDVPAADGGTRKETWAETCRRVVLGNLSYAPTETWLPDEDVRLFRLIYGLKAIPAGRHLWVTGVPEVSAYSRNCLARETEVITRQGVKRLGEIVGQPVEVLDGHGHWTAAVARSFGAQALMKITLTRGKSERKEIFATADHGWFTAYKDGTGRHSVRRETKDLKPGHRLASVRGFQTPRRRLSVSPVGVQHGFVFGDGSCSKDPNGGAAVYFCGHKIRDMVKWFPNHEIHTKQTGVLWAGGNPRAWKELPPLTEAVSYLYGFLAGYFAADGSIDTRGSARLHSASYDDLMAVRSICAKLGVPVHLPSHQRRLGYGDEPSDIWSIAIDAGSLTEEFFLISEHRERWVEHYGSRPKRTTSSVDAWTVESIEGTNRFEEVYCFEIPTTHSFVLAENILTSNCFVAGWSPRLSSHFEYLAARLFEGGGVGANYSGDLVSVTPPVMGTINLHVICDEGHRDFDDVQRAAGGLLLPPGKHFPVAGEQRLVVEDSREGWASAWSHLIDLSTNPGAHTVVLDVSGIRHRGAPLRRFGGRASGPGPFVATAIGVVRILNGAVGRRLSGIEAMQIDHQIASAVVAGGTRRSARLALMHWRDPEVFDFITCKSDHTSHWSANISVEIDREFRSALESGDPHATAVLDAVTAGMALNGEPGLIDTGLASETEPVPVRNVNPCAEAFLATDPVDGAGESCNLGQVDLDAFGTDLDGATEAVELMARFLYRSTLNPHPDEAARRIEARNRRIGTGIMGVQGWCAAHGYKLSELPNSPELLSKLHTLRRTARTAADSLADQLGTPRSVKVTAVAPTGTISNLRGTTPGPHPVFARHFIRRVRYSANDPALERLAAQGYNIEDDIYAASTKVVSFPMQDSVLDRHPEELIEQSDEVGFAKFADIVAAVQEAFCGGTDGQAVSATAQIPEGYDPADLAREIRARLGKLKGITVFPAVSRPMSPLEAISSERYEEMAAMTGPGAAGDSSTGCVGGACPVR